MCTVILLRRPDHAWPLLLAGNRDEMKDRPWRPPGRHWPEAPDVTAGLDEAAGGSWLGLNDHGVVAAILNRTGSLGPLAGKRSRGELVLDALDHADAAGAAESLLHLNAAAYRPFNLVIADNRDAFWLRAAEGRLTSAVIPVGLSMLTDKELNDQADGRIKTFLPRFAASTPPDPDQSGDRGWQALLAETGINFQNENGFGTRCSSVIALPSMQRPGVTPLFLFAAGPPDQTEFSPLLL